ncbi:MAG: DUF5000 domain-containing lipoprotein [Bacteroidota bacterium]
MWKLKNLVVVSILLIAACKQDKLGPIATDSVAPKVVTGIVTTSIPGGAKITYALPDSKNLLYVKAVYESPAGVVKEVKSSLYDNTVTIQGLGSAKPIDVKLYSVSQGETLSEPVIVNIKPDVPPVLAAFATLTLDADFGGATATYKNPSGANLVYTILVGDGSGGWNEKISEVLYTSTKQGSFGKTGLAATPTKFGLFVRDRWDNHSDTIFKTLTPFFEKQLDKTKFHLGLANATNTSWSILPGDISAGYSAAYTLDKMYDGILTENPAGLAHSLTSAGQNCTFTLDLGLSTKLSRYKYYMRGIIDQPTYIYNFANPSKWEIWGSNAPNPNGSFDSSWTLIMTNEVIKPSGSPLGTLTVDDRAAALAGIEFRFPANTPPYRYIRWKNIATFANLSYIHIQELTFFGQ